MFFCTLKIIPIYMFMDPIVVGVLRTRTHICVPRKEFIYIGVSTGRGHKNKDVDTAKRR